MDWPKDNYKILGFAVLVLIGAGMFYWFGSRPQVGTTPQTDRHAITGDIVAMDKDSLTLRVAEALGENSGQPVTLKYEDKKVLIKLDIPAVVITSQGRFDVVDKNLLNFLKVGDKTSVFFSGDAQTDTINAERIEVRR